MVRKLPLGFEMKLEDYTKQELIIAIRKLWKTEEKLLVELPIIKYNIMCDKAQIISNQASEALNNDEIQKAMKLFDESNAMWEKANSFIDGIRKQYDQNSNSI